MDAPWVGSNRVFSLPPPPLHNPSRTNPTTNGRVGSAIDGALDEVEPSTGDEVSSHGDVWQEYSQTVLRFTMWFLLFVFSPMYTECLKEDETQIVASSSK